MLCPGFVKTQIIQAERNRPSEFARKGADAGEGAISMAQALIDQGKDPAEIANTVFDSIEQDRLYILPHPAWDDTVRSRVEHVLERGGPAALNLEDMMQRRAKGEQF